MNISETIKALPDGDAKIWGVDIDNCPVEYIGTFDDLKRLLDVLEKCETAVEGIGVMDLGMRRTSENNWGYEQVILLSEIREALGK